MSPAARFWFLLAAAVLVVAADGAAQQPPAAEVPFTGEVVLDFVGPDEAPLRMPTDVVVADGSVVCVADGVNDRVLIFSADGGLLRVIDQVGERPLSRPVGVDLDASGSLWIADTGNARLVAVGLDGTLRRELAIPAGDTRQPRDLTDLALSSDGAVLWAVDNENHELLRFELAGETMRRFGGEGDALGRLFYPFMLATHPSGDVFVSEAINARVQYFGPDGRTAAWLGTYGVDLGQLHRPKGVAVDAAGRVWIADGTMGVIQAFRATGGVIDVLRDSAGAPLKFAAPCGIDFDAAGNLYVAELGADRVRKLRISLRPEQIDATRRQPPPAPERQQPRACTACHVEWLDPLVRNLPTQLMQPPATSPGHPAVSRSGSCLSCHDSSVADSRASVWVEHGHTIGQVPGEEMLARTKLPLPDQQIQCRTCHSAHTRGGAGVGPQGHIFHEAVFLRVTSEPSELCISCHGSMGGGVPAGMHPLTRAENPTPDVLLAAGARPGTDHNLVTCLVCHTGHGATDDLILRLNVAGNELCLACHTEMRADAPPHPLDARLSDEQQDFVHGLGRRVGPDGSSTCLSCHRMHHAADEHHLLEFQLASSEGCVGCHRQQGGMLGASHDLRASRPDVFNALGLTAVEGGPCSACHMVHNLARAPQPAPADAAGHCLSCHRPEQMASSHVLGSLNHPGDRCTDCHDPHETRFDHYLSQSPAQLCIGCHAEHGELAGGPHDVQAAAAAQSDPSWPAAALAADDACLACHRPHGDETSTLFRAGVAAGLNASDGACVACHANASWNAGEHAALHTRDASAITGGEGLPLVEQADGQAAIGCRTCHDPHRGGPHAAASSLLRVAEGAAPESLCISCHASSGSIELTSHSAASLAAAGLESGGCRPCHVLHAPPERVRPHLLWPHDLGGALAAADATAVNDPYCTACHHSDGPAVAPAVASHPEVPMSAAAAGGDPGLPLFDAAGQCDPRGKMTCRTCHLPHGRPWLSSEQLAGLTPAERSARKIQLRPFEPPNACTACHGFDGLRRFLYFHDPQRRGGPLQRPAEPLDRLTLQD